MPELPEVETVMNGLRPVMEGARFAQVTLRREGLRWPFPKGMADALTGARVQGMRRRSKYILVDTDRGQTLLIHLGMSGRMIIHAGNGVSAPAAFFHNIATPEKHDHVVFDMESEGSEPLARILFNDARRFGALDLLETATADTHKLLRDIGPEPLGNRFHAQYLADRLKARKMPIKSALLDQKIVAGLGNIYVCESLWRAGIHPQTLAGEIPEPKLEQLCGDIRDVLTEAIASGGSSLKDFRQASGELGYFQHNFAVYGRENAPCRGCGTPVERIVQSGRSTFYCPDCQSLS